MPLDKLKKPHFDAALHTYADSDGFKYTSVTRWIDKYKPFFDKEKIAQKVAQKNNISVEMVLKEWDEKRDNSAVFGTRVHKAIETFNSKDGLIEDAECTVVMNKLLEAKINLNKKDCYFEQIISDRSLGIAGTADVVEIADKKSFNIYDFKTNKKFRFQTMFGNETLLKPFNHLPNTEYFLYAFQLSMYAYMLKRITKMEPKKLRVLWYQRDEPENYSNFNGSWKIYDVPYLEHDIEKSFETTQLG